jgi:hypothetical protein
MQDRRISLFALVRFSGNPILNSLEHLVDSKARCRSDQLPS